eukprot:567817-Pyramimonas_sp.AAC.1
MQPWRARRAQPTFHDLSPGQVLRHQNQDNRQLGAGSQGHRSGDPRVVRMPRGAGAKGGEHDGAPGHEFHKRHGHLGTTERPDRVGVKARADG